VEKPVWEVLLAVAVAVAVNDISPDLPRLQLMKTVSQSSPEPSMTDPGNIVSILEEEITDQRPGPRL
jgi:hypothetical protein